MKKIISLCIAMMLLVGCTPKTTDSFTGEVVTDLHGGYLRFDLLDGSQEFEVNLKEDTNAMVTLENEKGSFSVAVTDPDGKEIYSGKMKETGTFKFGLGIHESGTYKVTVTGEKAQGRVDLIVDEKLARFTVHNGICEDIKSLGMKYYVDDEVVSSSHVEEPDGSALRFEELNFVLYESDLPENCDLDSFGVGFVIDGKEVTKVKLPLHLKGEYVFDILKDKDELVVWQIVR